MASSSSLSPPSSSLPSSTSLSHTHPPPSSTFSTTDVLQRSFDTFNALLPNSHASSPTIDEAALKVALQLLASTPSPSASPSASPSPPSSVPVVSPADARAIMDIVAGPDADRLTFSQFHNVYAAVNILNHLSKQDLPHLRLKDVKRALISAGINPTQAQLDGMMVLGDQYSTFDKRGQLEFKEFLRIYNQARTNPAHVFLHSWFAAGRNSTAMRKPVEVSPMQDFLAGTAAGVSLTLVGHPFDTIKVRLQTQSGFKGGLDCLLQTVRNEGVLSLFKGMSGPLCTIPLVNAVVFWSYAMAKNFLHRLQSEKKPLQLWEITLAGSFAGLVNCLIICPVELVKTRLQVQFEPHLLPHPIKALHRAKPFAASAVTSTAAASSLPSSARPAGLARVQPLLAPISSLPHSPAFHGPIDCVQRIVQQNGVKGLFRGMSATIYREVPAYGGQFFCYEALKRFLTPPGEKGNDLSAARLLLAGGTAGTFGWILSYPMDFVKSQLQSEPYNQPTPWKKHTVLLDGGFIDCWQRTVKELGWRALWRGFGPCLARAFPANAAGFFTYELTLKLLRAVD